MNVIKQLVPEMTFFSELLENYKKFSKQINNIKLHLFNKKGIKHVRKQLLRIRDINGKRANIGFALINMINALNINNREVIASFLLDMLPDDILELVFLEENQLYTITKSLGANNLNLNIDYTSPNYSFRLKEYIIESIISQYNQMFLIEHLAEFVKNLKDIRDLKQGCMDFYPQYLLSHAIKEGDEALFDDVRYELNILFSALVDEVEYNNKHNKDGEQKDNYISKNNVIRPPKELFTNPPNSLHER